MATASTPNTINSAPIKPLVAPQLIRVGQVPAGIGGSTALPGSQPQPQDVSRALVNPEDGVGPFLDLEGEEERREAGQAGAVGTAVLGQHD